MDKLWTSWNPRAQAKAVVHGSREGAFFFLFVSVCLSVLVCLLPSASHFPPPPPGSPRPVSKSFQMSKSNSPRLLFFQDIIIIFQDVIIQDYCLTQSQLIKGFNHIYKIPSEQHLDQHLIE